MRDSGGVFGASHRYGLGDISTQNIWEKAWCGYKAHPGWSCKTLGKTQSFSCTVWLGLCPTEPGTCLGHGIWDFPDSLHCIINCWFRKGTQGPTFCSPGRCAKVGNSFYAITHRKLLSICTRVYFLPLPGGCLSLFMHYILEQVLRNLFSLVETSNYRENHLLIKAKDSYSGFLTCLPFELTIQYLIF